MNTPIELIVMDVDGCLTDGRIIYSNAGDELKAFDVKDGLAIASWIRLGKECAIITGRKSKIVERRAKELGITHLYQGVKNKKEKLKNLSESLNINLEKIAVIGDDFNDMEMLNLAGLSFTPFDGVEFVKNSVDIVLKHSGGRGAVREMIDIIIQKNGLESAFRELWFQK